MKQKVAQLTKKSPNLVTLVMHRQQDYFYLCRTVKKKPRQVHSDEFSCVFCAANFANVNEALTKVSNDRKREVLSPMVTSSLVTLGGRQITDLAPIYKTFFPLAK